MNTKLFAWVFVVLVSFGITNVAHAADEILINDCEELQWIGNEDDYELDSDYKLASDIDCSATTTWNDGAGFEPIGTSANPFTGNLDGNNKTISNLFINRGSSDSIGLFGVLKVNETELEIKNLTLDNFVISGRNYIGALVGYNEASSPYKALKITNVHLNSTSDNTVVEGDSYVGGLVGSAVNLYIDQSSVEGRSIYSRSVGGGIVGFVGNEGPSAITIKNTYTNVSVYPAEGAEADSMGGIAGTVYCDTLPCDVENVYTTGNVEGNDYVGGLFGYISNTQLTSVYSTGNITGREKVGGLVGYTGASSGDTLGIDKSYTTGTIAGNLATGGLLGYNDSATVTIDQCYSTSDIDAVDGEGGFGGLIGYTSDEGGDTIVSNSYATGEVNAPGASEVGGLIGSSDAIVSISNSYATGGVSGLTYVGGLLGATEGSSIITNSFYTGAVHTESDQRGSIDGYNNGNNTYTGNYWYQNPNTDSTTCYPPGGGMESEPTTGNDGCTFKSDLGWFKGNSTNAPMASWTFPTIWLTQDNDYPILAWQEEDEEEQEEIVNNPDEAKITSWSAYKYTDVNKSCSERLKLTIKGKRFDDDAKVFIGGKEAAAVNVKNSKKLTAKFCLTKLLDNQTDHIGVITVKNPDTQERKADKQIDLNDLNFEEENNNNSGNSSDYYNQKTQEGARHIQEALNKLGYLDAENITSTYGSITIEAVKKFQQDNGIEPTGFVGPLTKAKLVEKTK